jgi:hypothetical protein
MALRKRINRIDKSQIRTGQVLEIDYDGDKDLILVIDPKATVVANTNAKAGGVGQGRVGKLHAIKLQDLLERQLYDLITEIRDLTKKNITPSQLSSMYRGSIYAQGGLRNYRTYTIEKINRVARVTLGQPALQTNIIIGNSVLYGVKHGDYVEVVPDEYDMVLKELTGVGGKIYYEGQAPPPSGDWPVIDQLINLVDYTGTIQHASWEPIINDMELANRLYMITDIFGSDSSTLWEQLQSTSKGNTLVEKIVFRSEQKYSKEEIIQLVNLANYPTTMLNNNFNTIEKSDFLKFHETLQNRAFADYGLTEEVTEFTKKQQLITDIRQQSLINSMRKSPGVYFAGLSHVDKLKRKGY